MVRLKQQLQPVRKLTRTERKISTLEQQQQEAQYQQQVQEYENKKRILTEEQQKISQMTLAEYKQYYPTLESWKQQALTSPQELETASVQERQDSISQLDVQIAETDAEIKRISTELNQTQDAITRAGLKKYLNEQQEFKNRLVEGRNLLVGGQNIPLSSLRTYAEKSAFVYPAPEPVKLVSPADYNKIFEQALKTYGTTPKGIEMAKQWVLAKAGEKGDVVNFTQPPLTPEELKRAEGIAIVEDFWRKVYGETQYEYNRRIAELFKLNEPVLIEKQVGVWKSPAGEDIPETKIFYAIPNIGYFGEATKEEQKAFKEFKVLEPVKIPSYQKYLEPFILEYGKIKTSVQEAKTSDILKLLSKIEKAELKIQPIGTSISIPTGIKPLVMTEEFTGLREPKLLAPQLTPFYYVKAFQTGIKDMGIEVQKQSSKIENDILKKTGIYSGAVLKVGAGFIPTSAYQVGEYYLLGKAFKYVPKITGFAFAGLGAYKTTKAKTPEEIVEGILTLGVGAYSLYAGATRFKTPKTNIKEFKIKPAKIVKTPLSKTFAPEIITIKPSQSALVKLKRETAIKRALELNIKEVRFPNTYLNKALREYQDFYKFKVQPTQKVDSIYLEVLKNLKKKQSKPVFSYDTKFIDDLKYKLKQQENRLRSGADILVYDAEKDLFKQVPTEPKPVSKPPTWDYDTKFIDDLKYKLKQQENRLRSGADILVYDAEKDLFSSVQVEPPKEIIKDLDFKIQPTKDIDHIYNEVLKNLKKYKVEPVKFEPNKEFKKTFKTIKDFTTPIEKEYEKTGKIPKGYKEIQIGKQQLLIKQELVKQELIKPQLKTSIKPVEKQLVSFKELEKVKVSNVALTKQIKKELNLSFLLQKSQQKQKFKQQQMVLDNQLVNSALKSNQVFSEAQAQPQALKLIQPSQLAQPQIEKQLLVSGQLDKILEKERTLFMKNILKNTLKIPSIKKEFKEKGLSLAFDVFGKQVKTKKYIKLNKVPLREGDAKSLGAYLVDRSLSTNFKIQPSTKPPQEPKLVFPRNYFQLNEGKFRNYQISKGKRVPLKNKWIEKKGLPRLDTPEEVQKITLYKKLSELRGKSVFSKSPLSIISPSKKINTGVDVKKILNEINRMAQ